MVEPYRQYLSSSIFNMVPLWSRKSVQNAADLLKAIARVFLAHNDWSNMKTKEK